MPLYHPTLFELFVGRQENVFSFFVAFFLGTGKKVAEHFS